MLTKQSPATHRHPWSREELVILFGFIATSPIIFLISLFTAGDISWLPIIIVAALTLPVVFFLYRLGKKRKNASELSAYVEDGVLYITGFGLTEQNSMELNSAKSVTTKTHGLSDALVFDSPSRSKKGLVVPERLIAASPELTTIIEEMAATAKTRTQAARDLLERVSTRK